MRFATRLQLDHRMSTMIDVQLISLLPWLRVRTQSFLSERRLVGGLISFPAEKRLFSLCREEFMNAKKLTAS